jgi:hypothetical protein
MTDNTTILKCILSVLLIMLMALVIIGALVAKDLGNVSSLIDQFRSIGQSGL